MPELRELQKKLDSVDALGDVVEAMRNLSAIYVRRSESALDAVRPYAEIVETCLDILLTQAGLPDGETDPASHALAVVIAGEQGLCGSFNERAVEALREWRTTRSGHTDTIVVGRRAESLLRMAGIEPLLSLSAPTSLEGVRAQVTGLTASIHDSYATTGATCLYLVYNRYAGMGRFDPTVTQVLPPRRGQLSSEKRTFRCDPILTDGPETLLGPVVEEYFFIELYRALAESHSSENGARLMAMTAAASNIGEHTESLTQAYQSARQDVITAELLDVVGGAEALRAG